MSIFYPFRVPRIRVVTFLAVSLSLFGCGGGPVTPTPVASIPPAVPPAEVVPSPEPAPTPSPVAPAPDPVPTDGRYPNGQTVVTRFTIKIFWIEDKDDKLRAWNEGDPIYVGETIRFDCTGKDEQNRPTEGSGDLPRWDWEPDERAMLSGPRTFNPRAKVKAPGEFRVSGSLDGVESNVLHLTFSE